jgi:hypothetical protein
VNTVRSSSCEYQSRRRARLACKIRFVPLAKHWYMLRPSLPLSLRGQRYRLLNWGELCIAIAYLLPCFTNLTSPERTIRSQWVWFLTALLSSHPSSSSSSSRYAQETTSWTTEFAVIGFFFRSVLIYPNLPLAVDSTRFLTSSQFLNWNLRCLIQLGT